MLQPVVANDEVGLRMRRQQSAHSVNPANGYEHRRSRALPDQQRLITAEAGGQLRKDFKAAVTLPPVAARDHAGFSASRLQVFDKRHHQRRFTSPARDHIANDDNRHVCAP